MACCSWWEASVCPALLSHAAYHLTIADEFIHVVSPPPLARTSRPRRRSPGSGSPRTMSPASMSKSPSNDSLSALPAGGWVLQLGRYVAGCA